MEKKTCLSSISLTAFLISLAAIMERADETLLPAVYREVGQDLGASPSQLGSLTFLRAFIQSISSPLAGIFALHYSRSSVIGFGTLFWAISTAGVGASHTLAQCAVWRAVNGIGLALVIPSLQSFIADSNSEKERGFAFGWLSFVGCIGGIGGGMVATILAGHTFWGYAGWRVAHMLIALISSVIGVMVHFLVTDPKEAAGCKMDLLKHQQRKDDRSSVMLSSRWKESWNAIRVVLKVPSFQIIVLQGVVGSIPWASMVFFTMWFELIGFGHEGAATLMGIFYTGCAFGSFFGGWVSDRLIHRYPFTGRVMCAQFSSFMGIPFSFILLLALPQDNEKWNLYAVTLACMGWTISWCQCCANSPIFADVVNPKHRTMIYAFDRAFEGSFAALSAPIVGLLAEKVFGYRVDRTIPESGSQAEALALSKGLVTMMAIPFGLCCLFYSPLYITYRKDYEAISNSIYLVDEPRDSKKGLE